MGKVARVDSCWCRLGLPEFCKERADALLAQATKDDADAQKSEEVGDWRMAEHFRLRAEDCRVLVKRHEYYGTFVPRQL